MKSEMEVLDFCDKKATEYGFNMKFVDAKYSLNNTKVLVTFTSDDRMDLRQLVKDLANEFQMGVELRQI